MISICLSLLLLQAAPSGLAETAAAGCDRLMKDVLSRYEIPGGAIAVSLDGRILCERGYGIADVEANRRVEPADLFRIASVSKPVTSVAVLKLVEEGRLKLDDSAFGILGMAPEDPRAAAVTIRQLLQHEGGWDRDASFDPMFRFGRADAAGVIREMLSRKLDFAPGTKHAYSNFGYCVLGRVIEKVTGRSYESFVQAAVLKPAGIERMRIGADSYEERAPGEVRYHGGRAYNLLPATMDAHGGWIASAGDLVRFAIAVPKLLKPETIEQMTARPALGQWKDAPGWYAMGWNVVPRRSGANWAHSGAMPGTASMLVRTHNGMVWAILLNRMPEPPGPFFMYLDKAAWQALGGLR